MEPRGCSRDFALDSEKDGESDKGFQACTTLVTSLVLDTRHKEVGLEVGRPARGGLVPFSFSFRPPQHQSSQSSFSFQEVRWVYV